MKSKLRSNNDLIKLEREAEKGVGGLEVARM